MGGLQEPIVAAEGSIHTVRARQGRFHLPQSTLLLLLAMAMPRFLKLLTPVLHAERHQPKPVLMSRLSDLLSVGRNIEVRDFPHTTLSRHTAPSIFHPRENRLKRFIQFRLGHSAVYQLFAQYSDGHASPIQVHEVA